MGLIGKFMPKAQAQSSNPDAASPSAAAAALFVDPAAATASPAASGPASPAKAASVPTSPAKVALLNVLSPTAATAIAEMPPLTTGSLQDTVALQAASQQQTTGAGGAADSQATPRLLTRLVTSLKAASPRAARLGNLVAEDDSEQQAAAAAQPAVASADGSIEVRVQQPITVV